MSLHDLADLTEKALLWWLAAVVFLVLLRCLSGSIAISGMLAHDAKDQSEARPAPERVQLLLVFLVALVLYARSALHDAQLFGAHPSLPDVSAQFIAFFAASHSVYLGGKLGRHVVPRLGKKGD